MESGKGLNKDRTLIFPELGQPTTRKQEFISPGSAVLGAAESAQVRLGSEPALVNSSLLLPERPGENNVTSQSLSSLKTRIRPPLTRVLHCLNEMPSAVRLLNTDSGVLSSGSNSSCHFLAV